eukprot:jgi/Tetstr1/451924/TSEL_038960.t1
MKKLPMRDLPHLNLPTDVHIGFVGVCNPKKSAKTTVSTIVINHFTDLGRDLSLWQQDAHGRFKAYGKSQRILLATASDVFGGDAAADLKSHEPFGEDFEDLGENPNKLIVLDCSGPGSTMIGMLFKIGRFNSMLVDASCRGLLLVPLRTTHDIAEGALSMIAELKLVMPDHFVVPVPICSEGELAGLADNHPFWKVIEAASHGVIPLPLISPSAAAGLERIDRRLTEIADPGSREALAIIGAATGYKRFEAGGVASAAGDLVATFAEAIDPMGFTVPGA